MLRQLWTSWRMRRSVHSQHPHLVCDRCSEIFCSGVGIGDLVSHILLGCEK